MTSQNPLTDAAWQHQRELFAAAAELPPAEREAWLLAAAPDDETLRREVLSLLEAAQRAGSFLERPAGRLELPPADGDDADDLLAAGGTTLGPWRLLSRLGRGGMGTVYLAVRSDDTYEQRVAVKVLRRGLDTADLIARFRRERQILAQLVHPAIARLLDGGSTPDGRPFLVMEQVEGQPIDRFANQHSLSTRDRVRLFRRVVAAVAFAHQNLVVHRDLKPANILITAEGEPRLLDFGVAKLLAADEGEPWVNTGAGPAPFTPRYASPEQQSGGAITTASDVYSLGVVLRELLSERTGRKDRDLEVMLATALAPEREHRYPSAEALGDDLDRYLSGHPLQARSAHWGERALKFIRRHRLALTAAALAVAALVVFTATLLVQRRQVLGERQRAETVSGFLVDLFALPDPVRSRGENVPARELLDRGVAKLSEPSLAEQPAAAAELAATMGRSYRNLGLLAEAEPLLETALRLARKAHGHQHPRSATALQELADLALASGDYGRAESLSGEALALRRELFGESHAAVAESRIRLARAHHLAGKLSAAEASYQTGIALARRLGERALLAAGLERLAALSAQQGREAAAEVMAEEALRISIELHGRLHPDVALAQNDLALHRARHDPRGALALLGEAITAQEQLFTEPHPHLATSLHNLGLVQFQLGRYGEAEAAYQRSLALAEQIYRGDHPRRAKTLSLLARLRFAQGRLAEAEQLDREALGMAERTLRRGHLELAELESSLARTLAARGRHAEAKALFEHALATYTQASGPIAGPVASAWNSLAEIAQSVGDLAEAERLYAEALAALPLDQAMAERAAVLHNLASLEQGRGELEIAEGHLRQALDLLVTLVGPGHPDVGRLRVSLAGVLLVSGQGEEAGQLAREALATLAPLLDSADPWLAAAREVLTTMENSRETRPTPHPEPRRRQSAGDSTP